MKSQKLMEYTTENDHIQVIKTQHKYNPFIIYRIHDDGRKKIINRYADFDSVLYNLIAIYKNRKESARNG